ncbi:hypothetical protein PPERSA_00175 [Pseudocohnilembus persalinus]|uniref:Uncharacterized protein n=1 Tax=Pseudocohnilembus persalinus TaxID=266149 RepID=A0A0V0QCU2_PSEPJ|nr:hypothetical protein PPERSA_00175 [Pseudocohnilembus persalinus]|eukprot:KRX00025.1 hypothetical protein PPERSA_00175 [Pseudocohnilembus persalinus]
MSQQPVKILEKIGNQLGFIGFITGLYAGFLTRDEFNFSSVDRLEEISEAYYVREAILNEDIEKYTNELQQVEKQIKLKKKQNRLKQKKSEINQAYDQEIAYLNQKEEELKNLKSSRKN